MDALIAEHAMRKRVSKSEERETLEFYGQYPVNGFYAPPREYSGTMQHAWKVVEEMERQGFDVELRVTNEGWIATFEHEGERFTACTGRYEEEAGNGMPWTICRAALMAKGVPNG